MHYSVDAFFGLLEHFTDVQKLNVDLNGARQVLSVLLQVR